MRRQDERQMSTFMQYAVAAAEEALTDAGWRPRTREEQERTVGRSTYNLFISLTNIIPKLISSPSFSLPLFIHLFSLLKNSTRLPRE